MEGREFAKDSAVRGNIPMKVEKTLDARAEADPAAFFDEFYPSVRRFVGVATGAPWADVEDLVQETLLSAWEGRKRFRSESSREAWVLGIARNKIRLAARTGKRRDARERARQALAAVETEPIPQELLETAEVVGCVRRALQALDESYAEILVRRYFAGLPVREIAREKGESEKAAESRLQRAREALRDELKRGVDDDRT